MSKWAIVAIPEDQDPVWKYSSEKVPHMTLLFLGEQRDNPDLYHIAEFVAHVADTSMWPFMMTVKNRGPLGPDGADVLFFNKDRHCKAMIDSARQYLLSDPAILTAYNSAEQYPEWTPHLTMGYPATPAKEYDRESSGFNYVYFNRIALWIEEDDGPTFELHGREYELSDMAMSERVVDFLSHVGVKGMRWGIRKGDINPTETTFGMRTHRELVLTKKLKNGGQLNVIEKGFEDKSPTSQWLISHSKLFRANRQNIHDFVLKNKHGIDVGQATFFEDPKNRSMYLADIKIDPDHRRQGYAKATLQAGIAYAKEKQYTELSMISSPMGAPLYSSLGFTSIDGQPIDPNKEVLTNKGPGWAEYSMTISYDNLKHTETGIGRLSELIVQYVDADPELNQEVDLLMSDQVETFLAHFGIPGMRWGRRKSIPDGQVDVHQKKPGTKLQTAGGRKIPAHEDAITAATSKQKAKASTTDALSNAELQKLVTRMNLEQQYNRLSGPKEKTALQKGRDFVNKIVDPDAIVKDIMADESVKTLTSDLASEFFKKR